MHRFLTSTYFDKLPLHRSVLRPAWARWPPCRQVPPHVLLRFPVCFSFRARYWRIHARAESGLHGTTGEELSLGGLEKGMVNRVELHHITST
jgi:hypothetical protein